MITVFTPTYNRAYCLGNLFNSLCSQTYTDFEWLIVDDGSTDNTKSLVEGFCCNSNINIRYVYQKNGGKHRAINRGVAEARGELFFIVDSDDTLPGDSLETISVYAQGINSNVGALEPGSTSFSLQIAVGPDDNRITSTVSVIAETFPRPSITYKSNYNVFSNYNFTVEPLAIENEINLI